MSRLKIAVMGPFILFVALFASGMSFVEYYSAEREGGRIDARIQSALSAGFRGAIGHEVATMRSVTAALAQQELIRTAFRQRDREGLLALTQGMMGHLREESHITHLYFTDLSRVNFLRVHQPERFGDVINRQTLILSEQTGSPVHGIELGPLGTLTLRVVSPWYSGDQPLGYIELGVEIYHLLDGLREQFGALPLLFLPKAKLKREDWEAGMRMLARPGSWDTFTDAVLAVRDGIPDEVVRKFRESGTTHVEVGNRYFSWVQLPVQGPDGEELAQIGLVLDVTGRYEEARRFSRLVSAMAILGSGIVIALFWYILGQAERAVTQARDDLARREALYHGAFTGSRAIQLLLSPIDGSILDANPAATAFYGWSVSALTQMRLADLVPEDQGGAGGDLIKAQDGGASHFLSRHRLSSGAVRDVEIYSGPISVSGCTMLYSIIHDISGRMAVERERNRLLTFRRALLEAAGNAVVAADSYGTIVLFNSAAIRLLGYAAEDVVGRLPISQLFPGNGFAEGLAKASHPPTIARPVATGPDPQFLAMISAAMPGALSGLQSEWIMKRLDGTTLPVLLALSLLPPDEGGGGGCIAIAQDIAPLKALEDSLRASNAELEHFANIASHDLRQPLRLVTSYLSLIERRAGPGLDAETQSYLSYAMDGAHRMDRLIRSLMDYSRIGLSGAPLLPVSLSLVVSDALKTVSPDVVESGASVTVGPSLPTIMGDSEELNRLFVNLVSNALKYRSPDRTLVVGIESRIEGGEVVVWVQDNGIGMDPREHERAFTMFQRLVPANFSEGTGIGLAVSRKIVEYHRGRIWIESEPDAGCRFLMAFPAFGDQGFAPGPGNFNGSHQTP